MRSLSPEVPTATVPNGADAIPEEMPENVPLLVASFDHIAGRYPEALLLIIGAAVHRSPIRLLGTMQHSDVLQHMAWVRRNRQHRN
jgi:hypothetical protein